MLKHRASEGPAELQHGGTFIQETPGVRQSYFSVSLQRHRLTVICKRHSLVGIGFASNAPESITIEDVDINSVPLKAACRSLFRLHA
jgi:hypothetical protein